MKILLSSLVLVMFTASCSSRATQAVYDMMHERERQLCIEQGRADCPRAESYEKYKKEREELLQQNDSDKPL